MLMGLLGRRRFGRLLRRIGRRMMRVMMMGARGAGMFRGFGFGLGLCWIISVVLTGATEIGMFMYMNSTMYLNMIRFIISISCALDMAAI
jgi:hypothetical protein